MSLRVQFLSDFLILFCGASLEKNSKMSRVCLIYQSKVIFLYVDIRKNNLIFEKIFLGSRQTKFQLSKSSVCEAHLKYRIVKFTLSVSQTKYFKN